MAVLGTRETSPTDPEVPILAAEAVLGGGIAVSADRGAALGHAHQQESDEEQQEAAGVAHDSNY